MQIYTLSDVEGRRAREGRAWLEFLRVPSMSMGVYHLRAAEADGQRPHTEDEVYYVVSGRARFWCEGETRQVGAGAVIFVECGVEHRFVDVVEDLTVLVFFAPAEGTRVRDSASET